MSNGPALTAYDYFKFGHDTYDIARIMKISEAKALKEITKQRSITLGLPYPYSKLKLLRKGQHGYSQF